jgi:hypothetical protein
LVADYAQNVDRESRFSVLMHRNMRAKQGLSSAQYRASERGREWFRGTRTAYWWQSAGTNDAAETAR